MSAVFVQAHSAPDEIADGASRRGGSALAQAAAGPAGPVRPPQAGPVHVTAQTSSELIKMTLCAIPAPCVFSGEQKPAWPSNEVTDEHVAVCEDAGERRETDRWTSIADVLVQSAGRSRTYDRPRRAALVTCSTDLQARTCVLVSRDGETACFTACDTAAGTGAPDTLITTAWAASFVHCLLVRGRTLTELRAARLVIGDSGRGDGCVVLIPCAPLTDQV